MKYEISPALYRDTVKGVVCDSLMIDVRAQLEAEPKTSNNEGSPPRYTFRVVAENMVVYRCTYARVELNFQMLMWKGLDVTLRTNRYGNPATYENMSVMTRDQNGFPFWNRESPAARKKIEELFTAIMKLWVDTPQRVEACIDATSEELDELLNAASEEREKADAVARAAKAKLEEINNKWSKHHSADGGSASLRRVTRNKKEWADK